jgi:acyl-CoA reductase-like NAD-dependent aldehyde dehydrogenase
MVNGWNPKSKEKIEIINPANEELIGHVTAGTIDDIDHAVTSASSAFKHINILQRKIGLRS